MSRENKYRAWDKKRNVWLEAGQLLLGYVVAWESITIFSLKDRGNYEIVQYTGLKDNNGVEIYEGDVLKDSESIVIVKFVSGEFSVDYRTIGGKWRNYSSLFDYLEDYEGEIIGNIYENPELLEQPND